MFDIILRVIIIYAVVLVGLRLMGKREIGQMAPFDFVLLLLIANAVQNAMVGQDTTLWGGVTAAVTLLVLNRGIAYFAFLFPKFRDVAEGVPTKLIVDGAVLKENLTRENISGEMLEEMLREHGILKISEVRLAMLEIDGSISVIQHGDHDQPFKIRRRFRVFQKK